MAKRSSIGMRRSIQQEELLHQITKKKLRRPRILRKKHGINLLMEEVTIYRKLHGITF